MGQNSAAKARTKHAKKNTRIGKSLVGKTKRLRPKGQAARCSY